MKVLKKTEYHLVLPVLIGNSRRCPTFAYSVVENIIPGIVYADDQSQPRTVLIGTKNGIYFVVGNERNATFNDAFFALYKQHTRESARFTLFSASRNWDRVIYNLLEEKIIQMKRSSFEFNPRNYPDMKNQLSSEFMIREINQETIKMSSNFSKSYYDQYWNGIPNFLKYGFGFCVINNDGELVSECTSIFTGQSFAEIDIVTQNQYAGKGFAFILGKLFIDKCLERGLTPSWDCDVNNISSIKLAAKLGFVNPVEYSIFVGK
ncbi:GNAT family N-acetyltransferase [Oceanobacillus polygoni]|uniref:RimJ/RimL family protein N-acetyltransferase n=1 Tax=Oceanobacillus polygoni TaxID=1235259 RepID=A0A9X0YWT0_9BACI|nr:GNAT family N-acetyltransferase [Oceanobacillus polygoni]MBP2078785.1 RimJ/RimL family protein N-acetyltransferase [Oceanobacillus polygoni]